MKLHTHTQGQGPLLILLHGWGFSSLVWQDLLTPLSAHYTVKCIDLPGFGQSEFDPKINSLASFCAAVLSEINEAAIVMGWSLGGLVAQYLAIHHPSKVRQLICVASSPCFIKQADWPGIDAALLKSFAAELVSNYQKVLQRFLLLQFFGMETDRHLLDKLNAQITEIKPNAAALQLGLELLLKTDLRADLTRINCPMQFILGKLDVLVPVSLAAALTKIIPNAKISIIKGTSHAPFISKPHLFLESTGLLS